MIISKMETKLLGEFILLAQKLNYPDVADAMNTTPSTLSKHIQALEKELGVELFERTTRKIKLNDYGRLFLDYANDLQKREKQLIRQLEKIKKDKAAHIQILTGYRLFEEVSAFKKIDPEIYLSLDANFQSIQECIGRLQEGSGDILIFFDDTINEHSFFKEKLFSDRLVGVFHQDHPLAKRPWISWNDLEDEDFILMGPASPDTKAVVQACRQAGFEPQIIMNSDRGNGVMVCVENDLGISVMMERSALKILSPQVRLVPILPEKSRTLYAYYLRQPGPGLRKFLDFLKQNDHA